MKKEIIRFEKVSRIVDSVLVLENFNMHIFEGDIFGIVSINYLGKDELINLLEINRPLEFGYIYFKEDLINNYLYSDGRRNPVYIIDRDIRLIDDLTVADNIFIINEEFDKNIISNKELSKKIEYFIKKFDLNIQGYDRVSDLSNYEKIIIQIMKAVILGYEFIVINGISGFLGSCELTDLYKIIREYSHSKITFLCMFLHHEEAYKICNRMALMENGRLLTVIEKDYFTDDSVKPYIGEYPKVIQSKKGKTALSIKLTANKLKEVQLFEKECSVILDKDNINIKNIYGLLKGNNKDNVKIYINNVGYMASNPNELYKQDILFIDENPIDNMIFFDLGYMDNLCFLLDKKIKITRSIKKSIANEFKDILGEDLLRKNLYDISRKNLYKLIYYKVILFKPKIVFIYQPFNNCDMYLRIYIIELINELKRKGITVVVLTMNISDNMQIADRCIVINKNEILEII